MTGSRTEAAATHTPLPTNGKKSGTVAAAVMRPPTGLPARPPTGSQTAGGHAARSAVLVVQPALPILVMPMRPLTRYAFTTFQL